MALHDTVWREDVIDQLEVARDSAKVIDEWLQRLAYQGAHPELLRRLTEIRDLYSQVYAGFQSIQQCFPSPHQRTYG